MRRPDLLFLVVIWLFFSAFLYFIAIAAIAAPARLARATPTSAGDDRLPRVLTGRLRPPDSYAGGGYGTNIRSGPMNGVRSTASAYHRLFRQDMPPKCGITGTNADPSGVGIEIKNRRLATE